MYKIVVYREKNSKIKGEEIMSSNNLGKQFEKRFKEACEKENIFYHRISDSPTSFSGGFTQFTNKSLADAFIFYDKNLFVVEFKSTKYKSFTIEKSKEEKKMIHLHQINNLIRAEEYDDVNGCFVFNFREQDGNDIIDERTYLIGIKDFSNFVSDNDKSSINEQNIIDYNGIEIESVKKRKWFSYNVKDALNKFLQKG